MHSAEKDGLSGPMLIVKQLSLEKEPEILVSLSVFLTTVLCPHPDFPSLIYFFLFLELTYKCPPTWAS